MASAFSVSKRRLDQSGESAAWMAERGERKSVAAGEGFGFLARIFLQKVEKST